MFCLSLKPELYPIKNLPFRLKQGYPLLIPYRFFELPIGMPRQFPPSPFDSFDHLGLLRSHKHEDKEHRSPGEQSDDH